MQFYTVHEPPDPPADRIDRAGSLMFISDRFTPTAAALGPVWLLANRLWHAFAGYVAVLALVAAIVLLSGLSLRWLSVLLGAMNLIVGFEAASLKRWALERRGWQTLGTVSGRTLDECERRFLESWLVEHPSPASHMNVMPVMAPIGARLAGIANGDSGGRLGGTARRWTPWRTAR